MAVKEIGIQGIWLKIANIVGYWNITFLFQLLRLLYLTIDKALDLTVGYSLVKGWRKDSNKAASCFEYSAHFVDIIGRFTYDAATGGYLHSFILKHHHYGNPQEILQDDHITIQGATSTHAWFCVSDEDVYDTKKYPFVFSSQFYTSKQFVIVTHETLHKLADDLSFDDDKRNLIVIDNTARCGSTLACQMFAELPHTRVISEPFFQVGLAGRSFYGTITNWEFVEWMATIYIPDVKSSLTKA